MATTHLLLDAKRSMVEGVELVQHENNTLTAQCRVQKSTRESFAAIERGKFDAALIGLAHQHLAQATPEVSHCRSGGDIVEVHDQVLPPVRVH